MRKILITIFITLFAFPVMAQGKGKIDLGTILLTHNQLKEYFDKIVFLRVRELDMEGIEKNTKWLKNPILKFHITPTKKQLISNQQAEQITAYLTRIEKNTGLKFINSNKNGKNANFIITILPDKKIAERAYNLLVKKLSLKYWESLTSCRCIDFGNLPTFQVNSARGLIPRPNPNDLAVDACFRQVILSCLGLPVDYQKGFYRTLEKRYSSVQLMDIEFALLQILYDVRLKPGMSRTEANQILPEIIDDLFTK